MSFVDTRYGKLEVPDVETDIIGRFLVQYGEWAWSEAVFIGSMLEDGARVLDVGAFVGTFGLGLAMSRQLGFLCCVEANPGVVPLLRDNIARRAPCPAAVVEALVVESPAQEHGAGPRRGFSTAGNLGGMSFANGGAGAAPARMLSLAEVRSEHGPFDLIKIDVEGMEWDVLQGDAEWLAGGGTTLWIECNEDRRSLQVAALVLSWGLPAYYFAFPSHNPNNANAREQPLFPWAFEAGLLAAPGHAPVLTAELAAQGCILVEIRSVEELRAALWKTPRWGMAEWADACDRQELAALVGRSLTGETWEGFLAEGTSGSRPPTLWQQLDTAREGEAAARRVLEGLEARLGVAEEWAARRLRHVTAEQALRREFAARLAHAEGVVADRLVELGTARREREGLEGQLAEACGRALRALAMVGEERERSESSAAALRAEHGRLEREHDAQRDRLGRAEAEVGRAGRRIAGLEAELVVQGHRARMAEHAVGVMQASTMWRITGPARSLVHGLRTGWRRVRGRAGSDVGRLGR